MADTGLIIKNPTNNKVIFNTSTITSHSRAVFNTGTSAGSIQLAELLRGQPFIIQALPMQSQTVSAYTDITISGSTISWTAAAMGVRVIAGSFSSNNSSAPKTYTGLRVNRPTGALQIGSEDQTMQLSTWGSALLTSDTVDHPQPMVVGNIVVQGVNPIVAFRAGGDVNVERISGGSGQWTFYFKAKSSVSLGLLFWVFDATQSANLINTNVGFLLKNSSSVKTFDSRAYCLNLVSVYETKEAQTSDFYSSNKTYATIQSTPQYTAITEDVGIYSTSPTKPSRAIENHDGPTERPPNARWSYMRLYGYHSIAKSLSSGGVTVGLKEFERFEDWYPIDQQPSQNIYGTSRHTIIDITDFPTSTMPTPDNLSVTPSTLVKEVSVSSVTPANTVTSSVTVSVSGGVAPYSYVWSRRQGGGGVGAYGPTDTSSFQTQTANQPPGSTYEEVWGCKVIDSTGKVGYSQDITFRHIVVAIDVTPDSISYTNQSTVTNDPTGFAGVPSKQITGISQPITLRIERFNYSGNANAAYLLGYKGPSASGPWTQVANLDARGTAARYADFSIANNEWFYFYTQVETTSGRKTATYDVAIWNESTGHTILASANLSVVVDNDNNYNTIDYDLDYIDWGNIYFDTIANSYYTPNNYQGMYGINANITLSVQISGFYVNGGAIQNSLWAMQSASRGDLILANLGDGYYSATVQPGEQVRFAVNIATTGGRREFGFNVYVYNATTGAFIDHLNMSGCVG